MQTKDNAKFHIVLVTGVIEKNGELLIAQRSFDEIQAPGKWALPGGKVELFTNNNDIDVLERTLEKEIEEEVGVKIQKDILYLASSSFVRVDKASVIGILFLCKWKSGKPKPLEDTIRVEWISYNEVKKYDLCDGVDLALEKAFEKL